VQILRHPSFLAYSATTTFTYAGLFTYLAASSFTFIQVLGWSPTAYGLLLSCNAAMYITGTVLCRRLLVRWGLRRSIALAGLLSAAGGTLMGVFALAGVQNGWAYALPFLLYQIAHGIHMPCSQSGAVGPFPHAAGTAAALNGFVMMLVAFGVGQWLGQRMDGTVLPLIAIAGPTASGKTAGALALAAVLGRACRSRSSASIRPWCTGAWTLAPPSPRAPSWPPCRTT
jgi:DHA1 family bicyclomycin/chloramphenicol resistance-like MFS transporter